MDFDLSQEQDMLKDSVQKFVSKGYDFDHYLKTLARDEQSDPATWQQFADFGWLALPISEAAGGIGGSTLDLALVCEALGSGLVLEPFITSGILPSALLANAGLDAAQEETLTKMAAGEIQLAVAINERAGRFDLEHCETTAIQEGDGYGYVLNGSKHCAFNAPNATLLLVTAKFEGEVELFAVETSAATLNSYPVLGGGVAANVNFNNLAIPASARLSSGSIVPALTQAVDQATAACCAQMLGAMTALLQKTVMYVGTRKQFGVPIGSFQVLQHRLVDMFIELEQARSMVLMAAVKADSDDAVERQKAVSAAKVYLCNAGRLVSQQAVQLHGGIGVTEELDIGHYFRQVSRLSAMYGDAEYHKARFQKLTFA